MSMIATTFIISTLITVLLSGFKVNIMALSRSFVREEMANIVSLVTKDIRSAEIITSCNLEICTLKNSKGESITWSKCVIGSNTQSVCQFVNGSSTPSYSLSTSVNINTLNFTSTASNGRYENVIITVSGSHTNANLNIKNVIVQSSISTRNFKL
jgi:hypothetical protein